MFARIGSALRYLAWSEPLWRWRLVRGRCPLCRSGWFVSMGCTPFMTRCMRCRATAVNLGVAAVVEEHFAGNYSGRHAYELSSYGSTFLFLQRSFPYFTWSEYMPGREPGRSYDGIRNEDAQKLTFVDGIFDVVTSNQVFDHVSDDERAYRECLRVLKPGGVLVFSVPLYDTPVTQQIARLRENQEIEWLGTPEYHDSRLGGPKSAPTFWRHSVRDIAARVRVAGFSEASLQMVPLCGPELAVPVVKAVK